MDIKLKDGIQEEKDYLVKQDTVSNVLNELNIELDKNDTLNKDKEEVVEVAKIFHEDGFKILATGTTYDLISQAGIPAEKVKKLYEDVRMFLI